MTSSADGQDRLTKNLQRLWNEWGLDPEEAGGPTTDVLDHAVHDVAAWLRDGEVDPIIAVRAIQMLLADLSRTDVRKRPCWRSVCEALKGKGSWKNPGNKDDHLLYLQALVLASWPHEKEQGFLSVKPLFDLAWNIRRDDPRTRKAFENWRDSSIQSKSVVVNAASNLPTLTEYPPSLNLNLKTFLKQIEENQSHGHVAQIGPSLVKVLNAHNDALLALTSANPANAQEPASQNQQGTDLAGNGIMLAFLRKGAWDRGVQEINAALDTLQESTESKLNLLWWGQSRYCRALRKPYLRLKSDSAALLWWTAREAAELSLSVDVEPAAAYLVETLHNLDQPIDEKKSVLEWMKELDGTLKQASDKVPGLSNRLDKIAKEDALGLPVTWVRQRAMHRDEFDPQAAKEAIALQLDEEIDRGDWASWVFRETLLDLHLREEKP